MPARPGLAESGAEAPAIPCDIASRRRRIFALIREFNAVAGRGEAAAGLGEVLASIVAEVLVDAARGRDPGRDLERLLQHLDGLRAALPGARPPDRRTLAHALDSLIVHYVAAPLGLAAQGT